VRVDARGATVSCVTHAGPGVRKCEGRHKNRKSDSTDRAGVVKWGVGGEGTGRGKEATKPGLLPRIVGSYHVRRRGRAKRRRRATPRPTPPKNMIGGCTPSRLQAPRVTSCSTFAATSGTRAAHIPRANSKPTAGGYLEIAVRWIVRMRTSGEVQRGRGAPPAVKLRRRTRRERGFDIRPTFGNREYYEVPHKPVSAGREGVGRGWQVAPARGRPWRRRFPFASRWPCSVWSARWYSEDVQG